MTRIPGRSRERAVGTKRRAEASEKTPPVARGRRRPGDLGERRRAREGRVADALLGADVLGPDVGLHTEHVARLGGREAGRYGAKLVDAAQRLERHATGRLIRRTALPVIEVERR